MPRRVRIAFLIAVVCHGLFILTARYRLSYDAYTHMLFANHYAENWFSLWETRWYTGFTVASYPPLTHQLIALFIPILGLEKAYAFILWTTASLYPIGIYTFSRIFTGKTSSVYAALASAMLLPIYVTAHIFGQLPFLTSTLTALFAAACLHHYLRHGGLHDFALSVALTATSMAMHHATLMLQPFLISAVTLRHLFQRSSSFTDTIRRLTTFGLTSVMAGIAIILPFWKWGINQTLQPSIDHLSRHNFFSDPLALGIFFFPLYGPLVLIIPFLLRKWNPRFIGLLGSFAVLFLLGLGGTTPLPHLFFGDAWEWLTYDRFAFWASLTLTPFFGILFIGLRKKLRSSNSPGYRLKLSPMPVPLRRNLIPTLTLSFFAITALGAWFTPLWFPIQPKPVDMRPIVNFLGSEDNSQWRYVTFGFGDQFAYLNLLTEATTIDGSYHTARTLPELRDSGVGQIDTSYWALNGMQAILPILRNSGEHGVRWGFVNPNTLAAEKLRWGTIHSSPFIAVLDALGWKKTKTLSNGVYVYENPNAIVPPRTPDPAYPPIDSFAWGVLPMTAFVTTLSVGMLRVYPLQAEWVIRKVYAFAIGGLPLSLCFWLYRTVGEYTHPRVYFTYDHALFFLSDGLVLLAVVLWLSVKCTQSFFISRFFSTRITSYPFSFYYLCSGILLLVTISIFWSRDARTSLYITLHVGLMVLLILSLREWHETWTVAMFGLCAALSIQLIAGFAGYAQQSTAFLQSLDMKWPGILDPSMRGASVVQLTNGLRILRAYGTLPHPNILGGFTFLTLLGPIGLFFVTGKPNYSVLILLCSGIILIGLTFSRSAWLALSAFVILLSLRSKSFDRKRIFLIGSVIILSFLLTLFSLKNLVFTRIGSPVNSTEVISAVGRSWLTRQALDMIRQHPFSGMGIGSFIIELSNTAVDGAPIEPVHNVILLVTTELGWVGLVLVLGLFISVAATIFRTKSAKAVLSGATLTGLGVISLFDHYLWTLAPGRVLLALALGLWAGQVSHEA